MLSSYNRFLPIRVTARSAAGALLACSAGVFWTPLALALPPSIQSHAHSAQDSTDSVITIKPGDTRLRPDRVAERTDTIALLVTPRDSAERSHATLIRRVAPVTAGREKILRETQHYQFADGSTLDDTLDVRASTLAPVRYFSRNRTGSFDLRIDGADVTGWQTDSLGARHVVQAHAKAPFFVSIMSEAFAAAFPFESGITFRLPLADPPSPGIRAVDFRVVGVDTLNSVHGQVVCLVVTGPGQTTSWIARSDGHLVRQHWTIPNGTTVWKLPVEDVARR